MTQPGWYPDPSSPSMQRWWDGQRWTNEVHPGPSMGPSMGPPAAGPFVPFVPSLPLVADPARDLAAETQAGRRASVAVLAGAGVYACQYVLYAFLFGRLGHAVRDWLKLPRQFDGTRPPFRVPRGVIRFYAVSPLISISLLAIGVLFLIWFEKAATVAARTGLPAHRNSTWAVIGWIIPIVNLWFPFQAAHDFFPPGHPGRKKVTRWWTLWIITQYAAFAVLVGSLFSTAVGLAIAVLAAVCAFAAANAARAVIAEVDRVHAGLIGR